MLDQHYQCRVPQPLIYEQLREWGIDISTGQVNRLLNEEHQMFEQEQHGSPVLMGEAIACLNNRSEAEII